MSRPVDRERHSAASLVLEQFLPYRLNHLFSRISDSLSKVYRAGYGLTVSEWRTLALYGEYDRLTATEISAMSRMDKTRVSRVISQLEQKGLIDKQPHESDNRATYILLSGQGRKMIDSLVPRALEWEDQLFERFDTREYRELFRIFTKLERRLTELEGDT